MSAAAAVAELGEWSTAELARAITGLTRAMERFEESVETTLRDLDRKYVPRELYDRDVTVMREQLAAARALAAAAVPREIYERDVAALRDRHASSQTWVRDLVAPLVTALMSGVILWMLLGVHHS